MFSLPLQIILRLFTRSRRGCQDNYFPSRRGAEDREETRGSRHLLPVAERLIELGVCGEATIEKGPRFLLVAFQEKAHDSASQRKVNKAPAHDRIIESSELQQDAIHPGDVHQVSLSLTKQVDRVVIAPPN